MAGSLPLQVQTLGTYDDQVLVLAHVAGLHQGSGQVTAPEVRDAFLKLHLPVPTNVSQHLSNLRGDHFVMRPSESSWAVTPRGIERIRLLMAGITDEQLLAMGAEPTAVVFGDAPHHLIAHEFAPASFQVGIARFLESHPFDSNVFGISRFPRGDSDPVEAALEACREGCRAVGLEFHLASDRSVEDMLFHNVAAAMWASRYGIALLEDRAERGLNYNVVFEAGAMLVTGRRCLLLKDRSIEDLPTDLVGHIYTPVDLDDTASVGNAVEAWAKDMLAIG